MKRPQKSSFDNPFLILIENLPRARDESSEMGPQLGFLQLVLMSVIEPFRFGFPSFFSFRGLYILLTLVELICGLKFVPTL